MKAAAIRIPTSAWRWRLNVPGRNNMPKENIERAIKRGTGDAKDGIVIEEAVYEGYAPHGVAVLISVVTDNRNRTVAEMRHVLSRSGGNMAEAGSVAWQFKRMAYFRF